MGCGSNQCQLAYGGSWEKMSMVMPCTLRYSLRPPRARHLEQDPVVEDILCVLLLAKREQHAKHRALEAKALQQARKANGLRSSPTCGHNSPNSAD